MPRRKCPACGSGKIVPIVYGYPSGELGEAERRGEVVLGGCIVGLGAPTHACLECHTWFDNAGLAFDEVQSFDFFIGGYGGPSHSVHIDATPEGGVVYYTSWPKGSGGEIIEKEDGWTIDVWHQFIKEVAACGLKYWKETYLAPDVMDGTGWHVEIHLVDGSSILKTGSNAYPPTWKRFIRRVQMFIDKDIF